MQHCPDAITGLKSYGRAKAKEKGKEVMASETSSNGRGRIAADRSEDEPGPVMPIRHRRGHHRKEVFDSSRVRAWPGIACYSVGFVTILALLVGLGVLVGHGPITTLGGLVHWLSITIVDKPAVTVLLAFFLLVLCAALARGLLLRILAWWPGSVELDFESETKLSSATVDELTARFRDNLSQLQLQSPTPMPGARPAEGFIDLLGGSGPSSSNWIGILVGLLRATVPTHAYRIEGSLFEQSDKSTPCGVSLQVVRLPGSATRPEVIYDKDWENAIRRAAAAAKAAILPRTRRCRGPWAAWRGYLMPGILLDSYEQAIDAERKLRYDEALSLYHDALRADPLNLDIRLRIGQLQERLQLELEALDTYDGILALEDHDGMLALENANGTDLPDKHYRRGVQRERSRASVKAAYRRLVLLGSERLIEQWVEKDGGGAKRADEEDAVRTSIMHDIHGLADADTNDSDEIDRNVRHPFKEAADAMTPNLAEVVRKRRSQRATGVTPVSVRLTRVVRKVNQDVRDPAVVNCDSIEEDIRRHAGELATWAEHYNAACAYAAPLASAEWTKASAEKQAGGLVTHAISQLERACADADTAIIASRRDWILSEDPDLCGLRPKPAFKAFEKRYFVPPSLVAECPRKAAEIETIRYARDLIVNLSTLRELAWHRHAAAIAFQLPDVLGWWREEQEAWQAVDDVAANYRDWRSRLRMLERIRNLRASETAPPGEPTFQRYEDHPVEPLASGGLDAAVEEELNQTRMRLETVHEQIDGWLKSHDDGFAARVDLLSSLEAEGLALPVGGNGKVCIREAAVWQRLREYLQASADRVDEKLFEAEVSASAKTWSSLSRRAWLPLHLRHPLQERLSRGLQTHH